MPPTQRSPNAHRTPALSSSADAQIASSNSTANAFLGSRRPAWLIAENTAKPTNRPPPAAAAAAAAVVPPPRPVLPVPSPPGPASPRASPPAAASVAISPQPTHATSKVTQAALSQNSDTSLLSPAPTDEPSPATYAANDSPGLQTAALPNRQASQEAATTGGSDPATTQDGGSGAKQNETSERQRPPSVPEKEPLGVSDQPAQLMQSMPPAPVAARPQTPQHIFQNMLRPQQDATGSAAERIHFGTRHESLPSQANSTAPTEAGLARFALISPNEQSPAPRAAEPRMVSHIVPPAAPPFSTAAPPAAPSAAFPNPLSAALQEVPGAVAAAGLPQSARLPSNNNPLKRKLSAVQASPSLPYNFAGYIPSINAYIASLGGAANLTTQTEAPRVSLLIEACRAEDGFFVTAHQLFCMWSVNRGEIYRFFHSLPPQHIDESFGILESVLKTNQLLRPPLQHWFASFPRPFNEMLSLSLYAQTVPEVAAFLARLPQNWKYLSESVMRRSYPLLMDELISRLYCLSSTLQMILFTASRRRLDVSDGTWGIDIENLFRTDQASHRTSSGKFIALAQGEANELESVNERLIAAYRQIVHQCKAIRVQQSRKTSNPLVTGPHTATSPPAYQSNYSQAAVANGGVPLASSLQAQPTPNGMQSRQMAHISVPGQENVQHLPSAGQNQLALSAVTQQNTTMAMQFPISATTAQMSQHALQRPQQPQPQQRITPEQLAAAQQVQRMPPLQSAPQTSQPPKTSLTPQTPQSSHMEQLPQFQPSFAGALSVHDQQLLLEAQQAQQVQQLQQLHQRQREQHMERIQQIEREQQMRAQRVRLAQQAQLARLRHGVDPRQAFQQQLLPGQQITQAPQPTFAPHQPEAQQIMHVHESQVPIQNTTLGAPQARRPRSVSSRAAAQQLPVQAPLQSPAPSPVQASITTQLGSLRRTSLNQTAPSIHTPTGVRGPAQQDPRTQQTTSLAMQQQLSRTPTVPQPATQGPQLALNQPLSASTDSVVPPRGSFISRSEFPHDPGDKRSLAIALHQAVVRSPRRVLVDLKRKEILPGDTKPERFYQSVQRMAVGPTSTPARRYMYSFEFLVTEEDYALRASRSVPEGELLPVEKQFNGSLRYRLRCCKARREGQVAIEAEWVTMDTVWPANIFVSFNDHVVSIRRQAHNGKDLAADITDMIRVGVNKLQVAIPEPDHQLSKSKLHVLGVEIIETVSHSHVLERIEKYGLQPASATVDKIRARLAKAASEDDVAVTQKDLSIDLADPFSRRAIGIPVRGIHCQHLECFDLFNWLNTRPVKSSPTCQHRTKCACDQGPEPTLPEKWRCPICSCDARPCSLIIDGFLLGVRTQLESDGKLEQAKSMLVAADGSWRPVLEEPDAGGNDDSDDEDDVRRPPYRKMSGTNATTTAATTSRRSAQPVEVIELDD